MPLLPDPDAPGHIFRKLIMAELSSRDRSRSWLADTVAAHPDGCCRANTLHYLRGDIDVTGHFLAVMFRVLDLHVTRW